MKLNSQQIAVIQHIGSPQIVIAGAGTGKTTVMMQKIKWMIEQQLCEPKQILALTFTNKAANEMNDRFHALMPTGSSPFFGTFHSFCLQFLRKTSDLDIVGITPGFTVIDQRQRRDVIQKILRSMPKVALSISELGAKISGLKQVVLADRPAILQSYDTGVLDVYHEYTAQIQQMNAVDFDDLLCHAYTILSTNSDVLARIRDQYRYVIVDEYQDTNGIQNSLTVLIAKGHEQICVVGDFDQTIYSWRGAQVENLLSFNQYFPTAITQKLEINYRSTKEILDAANYLIAFNKQRLPKELYTDRSNQQSVLYTVCYDEYEEAQHMVDSAKQLVQSKGYSWGDIAILYRTNQQSRVIEEVLRKNSIAYTIVGAVPFYQRLEIKVCIAYLQCLHHIDQPVWFEYAMLHPARGIGQISIAKYLSFCSAHALSISQGIDRDDCPLQERFRLKIRQFLDAISTLQALDLPLEKKLIQLMDQFSIKQYIGSMDHSDDRMDHVEELLNKLSSTQDLMAFLEDVSLFQDTSDNHTQKVLHCSTLHASKGLEFPVVYIPGFEDNILPLSHAESMEEERRLAYVGMTRAKDQLMLLSAYKRQLKGETWYHNVSTFIRDISSKVSICITEQVSVLGAGIVAKLRMHGMSFDCLRSTTVKPVIHAENIDGHVFSVGDVVKHSSLGIGTIQNSSGTGGQRMYEVAFSGGVKQLLARFAPLTLVS